MSKWRVYGSVNKLVKQFETNQSQHTINLTRSQSLEKIKISHNFKNIYDKLENRKPAVSDSSTNNLECLQLQEINQTKKKLLEITSALGPNSNVDASKQLSKLKSDVGNISDYGHASIKSEKAQFLPLLRMWENYVSDGDKSKTLPMLRGNDVGERKSPPKHSVGTRSVNSGKLGNGNSNGEGKKSIQRKYEKNPVNQQASNSSSDSKNSTSISRKISKVQASVNQSAQLPPKIKTVYELRNQYENIKTSNWNSTREGSSKNLSKSKPASPVTLRKANFFNSNRFSDPYGDNNELGRSSNQSENSDYNYRNSWHGFPNSSDNTSEPVASVSGRARFKKKYSGISEEMEKFFFKKEEPGNDGLN